jgi:hypothetical protein
VKARLERVETPDMKRTSLVAALAIAVLFGVGMVVVFVLTDEPRSAASLAPEAGDPLPLAAAVAPPLAAPSRAPAPARSGPSTAHAAWAAPTKDPASSSPPLAGRVIRKNVRKALLAAPVQARLARCANRVGGFGGPPATRGAIPRGKPAFLVLELETLGGEVRIVDAQVREWGEASEATVSCARDVLRGQVVAAPTAVPGERMRMPFPLNPRSRAVASSR